VSTPTLGTRPDPSGDASESAVPRPAAREALVITARPRALLAGLGILLACFVALQLVIMAEKGLTILAIALFLALALNPAVEFFRRRGLPRGLAVGTVCLLALVAVGLLGLVLIPPVVTQVSDFIDALPRLVGELTRGRGPLGFLERRYHVVEQVTNATTRQGSAGLSGAATPALGVAKGVATTLGGIVIIAFLTLFMLLEGPEWRERFTDLIPERHRAPVERVGAGVYRSVNGFVTGNLLASFLAGVVATIILLIVGVPYAVPLGLFTAIIELMPYIGPAVVTILLSLVALTTGTVAAIVVFGALLVYHMVEGHTLRPLIYGRALKLSALGVLIAIILGTEIAGILGALVAIPVAGSVQVIITELLDQRTSRRSASIIGGPV
jgi:predicted PurR-regulated permease PerM